MVPATSCLSDKENSSSDANVAGQGKPLAEAIVAKLVMQHHIHPLVLLEQARRVDGEVLTPHVVAKPTPARD